MPPISCVRPDLRILRNRRGYPASDGWNRLIGITLICKYFWRCKGDIF